MAEIGRKGGEATRAAWSGAAFVISDLPSLQTLADAKTALDVVRQAVLTRRITHAEGNAASKAVSEWVKADAAVREARVVEELAERIETLTGENEELREQLAALKRERRIA